MAFAHIRQADRYFSEFGLAFLDAKERCNARTRHGSFDTSVLEINQADLRIFLETLCEGPEGH
jgi:cell division control protein 45